MKKAYSYQRFSSMKQRDGDSIKRQHEAAMSFCKQFSLFLVETFRDEGLSGFHGMNFSHESALSKFLQLVDNGTVAKGSVLIVENMDRLSRQSILPCLSKFIEIINKDIGIGVVSHNKVFDKNSITQNPMELMFVLVEFSRAGSESQAKSTRLKSVITSKIERALKGEKVWFAVQKPSWVVGVKNGQWILDEEKMKLVKEIFSRYLAGHSCTRIANDLNEFKTPTLRNFKNGIWTNSTVRELLRNKNVVGWMGINGTEIENYFPQIITDKQFQLVQVKLDFNAKRRGGSKYGLVRNLFRGIIYCSECGDTVETKFGTFKLVNGQISHYAHYICRGVKYHNGCKNKGRISVSELEKRVFVHILNLSELTNKPTVTADEVLETLENKLAKVQMTIDRLVGLLDDENLGDMAELTTKLGKLKMERVELQKQIEAEKGKVVTVNNGFQFVQQLKSYFIRPSDRLVKGDINDPDTIKRAAQLALEKARNGEPMIHHRVKEYAYEQVAEYLKDTKHREELRNIMPSVIRNISLKFGDVVTANIELINGTKKQLLIKKK